MTDITERLRAIYATHPIATEAADEIDRLLDDFFKACKRNGQLKLERDRLREALEQIANGPMLTAGEAGEIAEAALAKEAGQ